MTQYELFGVAVEAEQPQVAPVDHGQQNKVETYHATRPRHKGDRLAILRLLRRIPEGLTRHQVAAILGMPLTTVCGRVNELKRMGDVRETGERRPTEAGKSATVVVYVAGVTDGTGADDHAAAFGSAAPGGGSAGDRGR